MSLINKISSGAALNKKVTEELFLRIFDVIKDLIINREEVVIDNFGFFKVERRKTQTMIDYNRKVVVLLPPKDKIIFQFINGSTQETVSAGKTAVFSSRKIVNIVSGSSGIDEIAVYEFFNILFEVIREYLEDKRNINIIEFGKFKVNRNNKISFSPAKKFSDKVNYNFNNLKARIIRSLNRDEIKKLYKERLRYSEDTEFPPEEITEVEEQLTVGKQEDTVIEVEKPAEKKPAKKDFIPPQIAKESLPETGDIFEDKAKPDTEKIDEDLLLKEKIESDFRIIEEMFSDKEMQDKPGEIYKEADLDILLMQDTEEAVEPVIIEESLEETAPPVAEVLLPEIEITPPAEKILPPADIETAEIKEEIKEIREDKSSAGHPYYTPTGDSPATEKIISDFEEKVKSFLKQADEERKSYEKELDRIKPPGKEITLPDMTGISEPLAEEVTEIKKSEVSFVSVLDKMIKDDDDEIEIAEVKTEGDFIIPEELKDITEKIIKEDEIEPAGMTGYRDTIILPVPPAEHHPEVEVAENEEENIPISEVYRKLKNSYMEETPEEIAEESEVTEPVVSVKPEETTIPEIEKPSVIFQKPDDTISEEIKETVFKDLKLPEPEIKLPELEISLPEPEISSVFPPVIKFPDTTAEFKLKDDDSYTEGLSYEDKKKEFEKLMQKYSDEFNADEVTKKDIEEIKSREIIPPISKPAEQKPEMPFKPLDEEIVRTEKDDKLEDLKSYIDKIGEKETDVKIAEDDSLPFKKVEDIDLPKSIDDYFEEIEEEFKKRKQNKNKDKQ
jgi:nucleoid DNA-binding protein